MRLTITIDMDNTAFELARDAELERIFFNIREDIACNIENDKIRDNNGNTVGNWKVSK